MSVLVKITRLVTGVVVMRAGNFLDRSIAVTVRVQIARRMPGVVMVFAWDFLDGLVPVPALIEISRHMPGMVMMLTRFFLLVFHSVLRQPSVRATEGCIL